MSWVSPAKAALLPVDCDLALIDGLVLRGNTREMASGLTYRSVRGGIFKGLRIHNVFAPDVRHAGILLSTDKNGGTLSDYVISGNIARIENAFAGSSGIIRDNLTASVE